MRRDTSRTAAAKGRTLTRRAARARKSALALLLLLDDRAPLVIR